MDRLWSPWRYAYVKADRPPGCVFCDVLGAPDSAETLVVRREPRAFVILNRYPYNSGHCMVLPRRHVTALSELAPDELSDLAGLVSRTVEVLRTAYGAEAVNLGANLGRHAGGSIDHLHLHCVPRWAGDTNFMPVTGGTKVLVELLAESWARLSDPALWESGRS